MNLIALLDKYPPRTVQGGSRTLSYRESGKGPRTLVLLHGVGTDSASWVQQLDAFASSCRVIAWDAPGYGASTPLAPLAPSAADCAERLHALLDALDIRSCVLVGHSLGALTAASAARTDSALASCIRRLVLISPAAGYGAPSRAEARARVRAERLATLDELGIAGMAAKRSGRLVSDTASERARRWVRWNMARLNDGGYRQAVELLCNADLLADLPPAMPVRVACGTLDVVTPPEACAEVARGCGVTLEPIEGAGHASYVERPESVAALLRQVLAA